MTERPDPIYQLLNGIISARTRDEVSMLAFGRLLHRCRSVHVMAHTSPDDMQRLLRGVTFAEKKAEQIPSALRLIEEKSGRLDLMFLDTWPEDPAMAWLMELPGTGPKVAGYGIFMRLVPAEWDADDLFEFHWLMKLHSQQVCTYEAPACLRCPLRDLCPRSVIRH
jgi:endonuclease-3